MYYDLLTEEINMGTIEQAFIRFMKGRNLSERTIKKYSSDTPNSPGVQEIIMEVTEGATNNTYHIFDIAIIERIISRVATSDFDIIGHKMYSAGLKKYKLFLES